MQVDNSVGNVNSAPALRPEAASQKLPRRDYVILPLLSIFTIIFMLAAAEITARIIWPVNLVDTCLVWDPVTGPYHKPNCETRMKAAETPWVSERFNNCGYRDSAPCGPKPPGTVRVALMGSSMAEGYLVPYAQTFAAQAPEQLSRICHRRVEFENMGIEGFTPLYAYRRLSEALALQPDLVMLTITPLDVERDPGAKVIANRKGKQPVAAPPVAVKVDIGHRIKDLLSGQSRIVVIAQHFLYKNEQTYAKLFLLQGEHAAFLRTPFTPAWERRFADLDLMLGEMAGTLHQHNIPFVLTATPHEAAAALMTEGALPTGVDPYAFDRRLAQIAAKHGIIYIDLFPEFRHPPTPDAFFYPENGHMTALGQAAITSAVVHRFLDGRFPMFSACRAHPQKAD